MRTKFFKLSVFMLSISVLVSQAIAEQAIEKTSYLPQFETTRTNVEALEENLAKTGKLAEILEKGNDELSEAIKQYKQDHSTETKDRIYNLLGSLAGTTVRQIDDITTNKDKIKDGVGQILYKMEHIKTTLKSKRAKFTEYIENTQQKAEKVKDELRKLARNIKSDSENAELRKEFRRKLYELRNLDNRYKTYQAHDRLNNKFGKQVELAQQFFQRMDNNTDQLFANLQEQKEFLVMKVGLLKDAAEMESWLRGESESNISAFAMVKKIGELSKALEQFNAATDVLIEMNDIGTLIESLPDAGEVFGIEGDSNVKGENFEDKYIEHFLKN